MTKICLTILICTFFITSYSQKYYKGKISVNTTWSEKDSPFFIDGPITIDTNITLIIESGSLVIFEDIKSKIEVRGKLIADGVTFKNFYNNDNHRDSIKFHDEYYSPAEYKIVKEAYDKVNYETWFMPGVSYTYYQPKMTDSLGDYSGVTVEYLIYGKVGQNNNPGPSHVRVYAKLNLLNNKLNDISPMFMYSIGVDLSIEKNPKRSYLIPYFGLEFGGMSQKQLGSSIQFTPTLGLHLLSKKNIYINLHGGYVYPMSNFEISQGWIGQVGVNFALW